MSQPCLRLKVFVRISVKFYYQLKCVSALLLCVIWLKFCFFLKRLRVRVRKSPNKVNLVVIYGRLVTSSMLYPCRWKHWKA